MPASWFVWDNGNGYRGMFDMFEVVGVELTQVRGTVPPQWNAVVRFRWNPSPVGLVQSEYFRFEKLFMAFKNKQEQQSE